ncbi:MAG: SpoIIE family protein phosphatase [Pseudobacteriovorax sp.]|nr:SpoIIE family protein phosphatase [Pseudobacteriovorax sp.]
MIQGIIIALGLIFFSQENGQTIPSLNTQQALSDYLRETYQTSLNDPASTIEPLKQIIARAKEKGWKQIEYDAVAHLGYTYVLLTRVNDAYALVEPYSKSHYDEMKVNTKILIDRSMLSYFDESYQKDGILTYRRRLQQLMEYSITLTDRYDIIEGLVFSFVDDDQHDEALRLLETILDEATLSKDYRILNAIHNEIGSIYSSTGEHDLSVKYYLKSLEYSRLEKNDFSASISLFNLGLAKYDLKQWSEGIDYLMEALKISTRLKDVAGVAEARYILGMSYFMIDDYEQAIQSYQLAIDVAESNNLPPTAFRARMNLIDIYLAQKQIHRAKQVFAKAKTHVETTKDLETMEMYYDTGSKIAEFEADYKSALNLHKKFFDQYKKLRDLEQNRSINRLKIQFDSDQQTAENNNLKNLNRIKGLKIERQDKQNQMLIASVCVAAMVLIIFGILLRSQIKLRRIIQSKEREISETLADAQQVHGSMSQDLHNTLEGRIAKYYQSAEIAGGDWLGINFCEKSQRLYLCLGDVTGHGMLSALLTVTAAGAIQGELAMISREANSTSLSDQIQRLAYCTNEAILHSAKTVERYMTMVFICIDLMTGEGAYLNAGHNSVFIFSNGISQAMLVPGTPLGLSQQPSFSLKTFRLNDGDGLFMYTDGLTDNTGPDGKALGSRVLAKSFASWSHLNVHEIKDNLLQLGQQTWKTQPFEDDCSFLIFKWNQATKLEAPKTA